jgi:Protein of unknown function (DUF2958)
MDNQQPDIDFIPVVKLFTPDAQCTWLLTELGLDDIAFGLCDLGLGCPEMGFVCMREIRELRGPLGLPVERDEHFTADKSISVYRRPEGRRRRARQVTIRPCSHASRAPYIEHYFRFDRRAPQFLISRICSHSSRRPPTASSAQRGCISSFVEHSMAGCRL